MRAPYTDGREGDDGGNHFVPVSAGWRSQSMPAVLSSAMPRSGSNVQLDERGPRSHWASEARLPPSTPISLGEINDFPPETPAGLEVARACSRPADVCAATLFFCFTMLLNCAMLNAVHFRMPDPRVTPPLRDFGFEVIPVLRLQWIADSMLAFFNVSAGLVYLHAYYVDQQADLSRRIWMRYFLTWAYCILMRTVSIFLTSLPPTDNQCQTPKEIPNWVANTLLGFVTAGSKSVHCGDLLFSGHTINICASTWVCVTYMRRYPLVPAMVAATAVICWFLIIAARSHYSIDVFIAICITTLCWHCVPEGLPGFLSPLSACCTKACCWADAQLRSGRRESQCTAGYTMARVPPV